MYIAIYELHYPTTYLKSKGCIKTQIFHFCHLSRSQDDQYTGLNTDILYKVKICTLTVKYPDTMWIYYPISFFFLYCLKLSTEYV